MQPEVEKLFHELADLTRDQRINYFSTHDIEPAIRREVERLLSFDNGTSTVLQSAIGIAATATINQQYDGRRCGPYRLLDEIGRGGMGTVYRAERVDGEITQQVAVKLLHAGPDRHGWQDRFLRERQLLADLNHPSIVRLLDAGHTEGSQPYLAMEYVDGLPIDRYAEGKELRHQLELFLRICDAVAHAHRNLIIHRDLKPSNILVDSAGQPKLLDFGIAKLIVDTIDPTQTMDRLLTPAYASPEQLSGARQTTATDVYSLGAILYRILTGRSPHETDSGVALDILTGRREIVPPTKINHDLPADLGYILMKALHREPEERYASVTALAEDLQRYLDSKPINAGPDSLLYVANKFVRRNRAAVVVVALVSVALVVTAVIAVREAMDARARFNQVRKIARTFLFDFHDELDKVPGTTKAKALLVSTAREYLDNLAQSAGNDRGLLRELAVAYDRLGDVQGAGPNANLGQLSAALESRRSAIGIRRRLAGESLMEDVKLIHSLTRVADDLRNLGRLSEALPAAREAVQQAGSLLRTSDPLITIERATAHQTLARVLQDLGQLPEAESEITAAETALPSDPSVISLLRVIAIRQDRADLLQSLGRVSEAISVMQQAALEGERLVSNAPPGTPRLSSIRHLQVTYAMLAEFYDNPLAPSLDQPERALFYRDKLCKGWEYLLSLDANNGDALANLAVCESETSLTLLKMNPRDAVMMARRGLNTFRKLESSHSDDAFVRYRSARGSTRLALALLADGRPGEAFEQLQPSLRTHRELIGKNNANPRYKNSLAWTLRALARVDGLLGRPQKARASLEEAILLTEPLTDSLDLSFRRMATEAHQEYAAIVAGDERCRSLRRARELWANWKGPQDSPWVDGRRKEAERLVGACSSQTATPQ